MKTIKLMSLFLLFTVTLQAIQIQAAQAKGNRQTRSVSGFHGISVSSGIDLYLSQKNTEEVVVEANSDELDKVVTTVEAGILKIYMKNKSWLNLNWGKETLKVYVSFKTLDKLEATSGSDVQSESVLKLDQLKLEASSGSDIKLELEANALNVESSSGSDILLKGKAITMQVNASSGSDIDAAELQTKKCNASTSSGSDIKINVTEVLDASASSGGDIYYSGNPAKKEISESSGGDVHAK